MKFGQLIEYNHSHKKQTVLKHGPNWPFYALMLRTKLHQNPFFFTGHQNVNNPKSRAARIVCGPILFPFYKIIVNLFSFFCQDAKTRSNCAIIDCNLSKKPKLILHKTQRNGESNYVDYKFFFNFCQELPVQKLGDRHPNTIKLTSWLVHILCDFKAT